MPLSWQRAALADMKTWSETIGSSTCSISLLDAGDGRAGQEADPQRGDRTVVA